MNSHKKPSTVFLYGVGWAMVVIGVALILLWWPQVVALFKSTVGVILAIAGLLVLYVQNRNNPVPKHITKIVIFDLDGTLVDAFDAVTRSLNYTFRQVGYPIMSRKVVQRKVGWGESSLIRSFVNEKDVARALGIYRKHHRESLKKGVRFLPGAKKLLFTLREKGIHLAIASNRPSRFTRLILRILGILPLFSHVVCADQVKCKKPAPDMLKEILRRQQLTPKEAVYVGDMIIDIQAGRRARMKTAAISTGSCTRAELRREKPTRFLKSLDEVEKILTFTNGQKYVK